METRKKLTKLFMITAMLFVFSGITYAQSYTISGSQTKGTAGRNAKLDCKAVVIKKAVKVVAISGNNNGFWINNGAVTIKRYYKPNDPAANGLTLKPGTYYVYPNLKPNQTTATVTLTLK